MFFKSKEPKPIPSTVYGFDYEFGIRGGKDGAYTNFDISSENEATAIRERILLAFREAIKTDAVTEIDTDLFVRGSDLTWFWAGKIWKK